MGKVMSVVMRKANRFNAENRAQRVLSKEKLPAAPKYPSNINDMERVLEIYPNFVNEQSKKDDSLNERLKEVYVTSTDKIVPEPPANVDPSKTLPLDRGTVEDFEYGFKEPEIKHISLGKCTLRQCLKYLTDHQHNPELWTKEKIANEYKLKEDIVSDILKYYKAFQMYIPDGDATRQQILVQSNDNIVKKILPGKEK